MSQIHEQLGIKPASRESSFVTLWRYYSNNRAIAAAILSPFLFVIFAIHISRFEATQELIKFVGYALYTTVFVMLRTLYNWISRRDLLETVIISTLTTMISTSALFAVLIDSKAGGFVGYHLISYPFLVMSFLSIPANFSYLIIMLGYLSLFVYSLMISQSLIVTFAATAMRFVTSLALTDSQQVEHKEKVEKPSKQEFNGRFDSEFFRPLNEHNQKIERGVNE